MGPHLAPFIRVQLTDRLLHRARRRILSWSRCMTGRRQPRQRGTRVGIIQIPNESLGCYYEAPIPVLAELAHL